jgi:hypothetical protein
MLTAYREFSLVTDEMIIELRRENQLKVGAGIESYTKRTVIRNLSDMATFNKEEIGIIYDKYFAALYYANHESSGGDSSKMNRDIFQAMLASMTTWTKAKPAASDNVDVNTARDICHSFIDRIYKLFVGDAPDKLLDFQRAVLGMSDILHGVSCCFLFVFFCSFSCTDFCMIGPHVTYRLVLQIIR